MNSPKRLLHRQQIEQQFDRAALTYDGAAELQRRMGNILLQRTIDLQIPKDSCLIDLGCGTGDMLHDLEELGFSDLRGLDLSSQMLRVAKQKVDSARFIHASIESIPCDDSQFDVVVSNAAIQWCDTGTAAQEVNRVLRSGGTLILNTFIDGTLGQWRDAFVATGYEPRVHSLANFDEVQSAFSDCSFVDTKVQRHVETATFDSIESMFASIRQLGATNAMSSRKRPMARKEYKEITSHFQDQLSDKGVLEIDFVWAEVMAKKMARQ